MANVSAFGPFGPTAVVLSAAQTGDGASTNVADRGIGHVGPALLTIVSTIGATPTVTVNIQGSADGSAWFNVAYATTAAPETPVVTALTITTATTGHYLIRVNHPWRYLRTLMSANTNVTLTTTLYVA